MGQIQAHGLKLYMNACTIMFYETWPIIFQDNRERGKSG